MKLTGPEIVQFCRAYLGLDECELDDERGQRAADAYAVLLAKGQAYEVRQRSLQKERGRIVRDQAVVDKQGNIQYGESPTGRPSDRPILWKNLERADAALEAWGDKVRIFDDKLHDVDLEPLPDDFFAKPPAVSVKQFVRTGFLPLMAKQQAARTPALARQPKKRR